MTRTRLFGLFITILFAVVVTGDASLQNSDISAYQIPEMTTKEGTKVTITCQIKTNLREGMILVKWLRDNQTLVKSEAVSVNGSVFINATLHLQSIRRSHSGMYYCSAHTNIPTLGPVIYGNGTHVYVANVSNSTAVRTQTLTPVTLTLPPNTYNSDIMMWSVLSGLGLVLLIICTVCVVHISSKEHCRKEPKAKDALVDATHGSHCPDTCENVVYAALNIPQNSVKSRNETCPVLTPSSVPCAEESVTYSEVHLKKGPKDES